MFYIYIYIFITTLHNTLALPNIENRMNNARVISHFPTHLAVEAFFGRKIDIPSAPIAALANSADPYTTRRDCRLCLQGEEKLRRKTRFFCQSPACQQHSKVSYTCLNCAAQNY